MIKCYHVETEQGARYGVAATNKGDAMRFTQERIIRIEENGDRPTRAEDMGSWPGVDYGTVLRYS